MKSKLNIVVIRDVKRIVFIAHRSYDADDRLTEERVLDRKNGIDRRVQYVYDAAGNVLKRTLLGADGECLESSTRYDLKDRATHRTNPAGGVTRYLYDRNDRLRKEISPYGYEPESDDGAGAAYTYDSRGNRLRTTNALGEVVQELSYNLRNQPVIQKDTFGNRTELSYELDGKIKDVRRSGNHQRILQQYEYNARGQITGVVDGNRNPISYDVDSWGRITGIGFADGVKEGYEYTPAGQVSRTIDGNGNAVQYRYNSLGKISERIDQLGDTETFRYDEEGNLSLHIDRDGRQLQRACNVFGQPVYEKASDAEGKHTNISTWHYDSLGRVTRAVCDGKSYEYIYDAYGNLKEKRSNGKRLVSYAHDRAGQITEIRDPAGVCTRYEYDILGRRSRIYNNDGLEVRYGYDALNRIRHIRYGNGVETAYTYDGDGNIRTLETRAGENVLLSFAYQYDGNGNRTAKTGTQATLGGITTGNNALDISYAYDVRGQLLEERRNGASVCYAYDKAGNRIRKTDAQGEIRYLYNEKNQLVEEESPADRKQFSYDRQGGIIEEKNAAGIRLFSYNSRRQQTRVETETGSVQENRYDAEGLRFELLENGRRTSFVYHDGELLQEEGREEQGTSYHLGAGMEAFRRGQELSYYHRDEQLSTAFVTSGQGEIRNSYQYDAFGIPLETTEQLNNRIRYTGQQYDELTEQYYLRARYYNPVAGRFMQEDVYQGDGLNLYAYCGNNPVVYWDPSGYTAWDVFRATIKGLGLSLDEISGQYHEQYGYRSSKIVYRDRNGNVYRYGDPRYRPSYGSNQVMTVWNNAKTEGGVVIDNETIIEWDENSSRVGVWDMGHISGQEYIEAYDRYMLQEYDPNDFARNEALFVEEYRNAENYHPQIPHNNRSDNQMHSTLTEEDFQRLGIERVDELEDRQQVRDQPCK